LAHSARGADCSDCRRIILESLADAVADRARLLKSSLRRVYSGFLLARGVFVCGGTWPILGRGLVGGDSVQCVDDQDQKPGRFDLDACNREQRVKRLRDYGGEMGILAVIESTSTDIAGMVERIRPEATAAQARVALFDFDGTISLI